MSYAQLEIIYQKTREGVGPDYEYMMSTTIYPPATKPPELYTALVVHKGDKTANELLHRVGNSAEVVTSPLDPLPSTVNRFSADSLTAIPGGLVNGDIIIVRVHDLPLVWQRFFGQVSELQATVVDDTDPYDVFVDAPYFPSFYRRLPFDIERASSVIHSAVDGVANRDYTGLVGLDFLAAEHVDVWDNFDDANNKYMSLRTEAQSLVDALNADNFSGTDQERYE